MSTHIPEVQAALDAIDQVLAQDTSRANAPREELVDALEVAREALTEVRDALAGEEARVASLLAANRAIRISEHSALRRAVAAEHAAELARRAMVRNANVAITELERARRALTVLEAIGKPRSGLWEWVPRVRATRRLAREAMKP